MDIVSELQGAEIVAVSGYAWFGASSKDWEVIELKIKGKSGQHYHIASSDHRPLTVVKTGAISGRQNPDRP